MRQGLQVNKVILPLVLSFAATCAGHRVVGEETSQGGPKEVRDQPLGMRECRRAPEEQKETQPKMPTDDGLELTLQGGALYDTNAVLLGSKSRLPSFFSQKYDTALGMGVDFNFSKDLRNKAGTHEKSFIVGFGGGTTNAWLSNVSAFDFNRYAARAFFNSELVRRRKYSVFFGAQYEYSLTRVGHDPFMESHAITPVLTIVTGREEPLKLESQQGDPQQSTAITLGRVTDHADIYYTYRSTNFSDEIADNRLDRDGDYHLMGMRYNFFVPTHEKDIISEDAGLWFPDNRWWVYLGYELRCERTHGTEFDLYSNAIAWGMHYPFTERWAFEIDGEFAWENYTAASIFDSRGRERFDFAHMYNFGLVYVLPLKSLSTSEMEARLKIRPGIELTFADSNISGAFRADPFEYSRAVFGLQFELGFRRRKVGAGSFIPRPTRINVRRRAKPKIRVRSTLPLEPIAGG